MAVSTIFGARVNRREDPRLVTGNGLYTADVVLPNMVHAAFLRSPYAHARIKSINTEKAKALPGVIAVVTGKDIASKLNPVPCAWQLTNAEIKVPKYDPVAVVVAETPYQAADALEAIEVEYEPLQAVVDQESACKPDAPLLYDNEVPNNLAFHWKISSGDVSRAFAEAEVTV